MNSFKKLNFSDKKWRIKKSKKWPRSPQRYWTKKANKKSKKKIWYFLQRNSLEIKFKVFLNVFLKSGLSELDPTTAMLEKEHEEVSFVFYIQYSIKKFQFVLANQSEVSL